jgi:hypothetical protein
MLKEHSTLHAQLADLAADWLVKDAYRKYHCRYAVKELVTVSYATFDVFGIDITTTMIEVKTSHADFLRDKKKRYQKSNLFVADYNFYFCPDNVIKQEELSEKWGLIYCSDNKEVRVVKEPVKCESNEVSHYHGRIIVKSIIRRLINPSKGVLEIPVKKKSYVRDNPNAAQQRMDFCLNFNELNFDE